MGMLNDPEELAIQRDFCDRGLRFFIEEAWPIIEPAGPFIPNWSIDAVCDHLEAAFYGELTRLVINVPPGTGKSVTCSVAFPSWAWTQVSSKKFIFASYSEYVSFRDSRRTRNVVESDWYRTLFRDRVTLDQLNAAKISTKEGGFRFATTISGGVTGEHADIQLVDDPIKPLEATGTMAVAKNALEKVLVWWNETMSSRLTSFDKGVRIIIMQRLHENDLAGVCKDLGYEHLMLPMEFDPKRKCFTIIGFEDPRTEPKELLFPDRFSQEAVDNIRKDLGPRGSAAQLDQDPAPAEGTIIKKSYIRHYKFAPGRFDQIIQSWDCTFKNADNTDYVVGQIWGVLGAQYYLLDQVRGRMGFNDTCRAIRELSAKWPKSLKKLVEDKANGSAVIDHLRSELSGLVAVNPEGDKESRLNAVEPLFAAGDVLLPTKENAPWVEDFIHEITAFPSAANDDQVDATSQALVYLKKKSLAKFKRAMQNIRKRM